LSSAHHSVFSGICYDAHSPIIGLLSWLTGSKNGQ
jgi:hypothetical protein